MSQLLAIRLFNGTSLDIDQDEWDTLASPTSARLFPDDAVENLIVQKHDDGRTLVYAVIERPGAENVVGGELLPPGTADTASAVRRIGQRFALTEHIVDGCLTRLASR
jgi:hypothetical protein